MHTERAIDFARIEGHGHIADALQKWTRKRIRNRRRLKKLEAKFGKKVNENGEPIDEEDDVPETVEEVRRVFHCIQNTIKIDYGIYRFDDWQLVFAEVPEMNVSFFITTDTVCPNQQLMEKSGCSTALTRSISL